jgi:aspartate carbamoyltransferase catalytic subunit
MASLTELPITDSRSLDEKLDDTELATRAMGAAFKAAVIRHRQAGVPMSFEEDGKIVIVPADQVNIDDIPDL